MTQPILQKTPKTRNPRNAQGARFIEAAREAGCSEDEAEIRENMKRIASAKPKATSKSS